jgi:TonB family protein
MEEALGTKVPVTKLGLPKATIDKKEIQAVIASHMKEVKYCYEKEAAVREMASGQITVKLVIDAKGSVQSAAVSSATLKDKPVTDCVLKAAARWKFPKPEGEGGVTVNYPFTFTSGK